MKTQMIFKLIALGTSFVLAGYWLHGHDVLTGIAISTLFLVMSAKIIFAFIHRHDRGPGGPAAPPYAPIPIPPSRPKPPELSTSSKWP